METTERRIDPGVAIHHGRFKATHAICAEAGHFSTVNCISVNFRRKTDCNNPPNTYVRWFKKQTNKQTNKQTAKPHDSDDHRSNSHSTTRVKIKLSLHL